MQGDDIAGRVKFYHAEMRGAWDELALTAAGSTILHARRFLDYHGSRLEELGLMLVSRDGRRLDGLFPVVAHPSRPHVATSHAGSSFGGIVTRSRDPELKWQFLLHAVRALVARGFRTLTYSAPPGILLEQPDDGLQAMLFRIGRITRCDLWSVLRLLGSDGADRSYWLYERGRGRRKGLSLHLVETPSEWETLHGIVARLLDEKYGRKPIHTAAELHDLSLRLGPQSRGQIICDGNGSPVAAQWFIGYGNGTWHNQYNAALPGGLQLGASSFGIACMLEEAHGQGCRQFSFGRSTEDDGWSFNPGLVRFKSRFGAGLAAQPHFEIDLSSSQFR